MLEGVLDALLDPLEDPLDPLEELVKELEVVLVEEVEHLRNALVMLRVKNARNYVARSVILNVNVLRKEGEEVTDQEVLEEVDLQEVLEEVDLPEEVGAEAEAEAEGEELEGGLQKATTKFTLTKVTLLFNQS